MTTSRYLPLNSGIAAIRWAPLPPLNQRIEQAERFLAERPDICVVEVAADFLDGTGDPHQRPVLQRFQCCAAPLMNSLKRINAWGRQRAGTATDFHEESGELHQRRTTRSEKARARRA